ncbi:MAG: transposase [Syntrophomonadaceae bacterium]|jgi:hypothetical protein
MAKSKHSPEWRLEVIEEYLSGQGSYEYLAKMHGIGSSTLREWALETDSPAQNILFLKTNKFLSIKLGLPHKN